MNTAGCCRDGSSVLLVEFPASLGADLIESMNSGKNVNLLSVVAFQIGSGLK